MPRVRWRQATRSLDSPTVDMLTHIKHQVLETPPMFSNVTDDIAFGGSPAASALTGCWWFGFKKI
eukprot:7870953-Lingulodinium_polyedra.AAC.1